MDYRDFKEKGAPEKPTTKSLGFWWTKPQKSDTDEGPHKAIIDTKKHLEEQQSDRSAANLRHMRLYGDVSLFGMSASSREAAMTGQPDAPAVRLTLNVIRACVDTVLAKTAKNRPKPTFVTEGGNWSQQQQAKRLDKFCQGQFYEAGYYAVRRQALRDALILGTGVKKFYPDHDAGTAKVERTLCEELLIDDAEGFHGDPRSLFQRKAMAREILLGMYDGDGDAMNAIERVKSVAGNPLVRGLGEQVEVVEAWHLPSHPKAKDGRHVICIDGFTLEDEAWKRPEFPFTFIKWNTPQVGFWGSGVAEQLIGIQLEINKLLKKIQAIMELVSVPRYLLERGSKVDPKMMTNAIGALIYYSGAAPQPQVFNAVPPELFQQLDRLYNRAFEIVGVSQLSANSEKPAGLNSGRALREYNDIETERFAMFQQQDEETVLADGRQLVALAPEIKKYEVKVVSRRFLETIKWEDIDLDADKYVMQMFPTSSLPSHPAARMQTIQEMAQAQWITTTEARRLMDMPDLENSSNIAFAKQDDIDALVDRVLEKGEEAYQPPEPYQDLSYGLERFQSAYLRGKVDGVPEDRLELLQTWMDQAQDMLTQAQAASQPPPGAGPAPSGAPAAPQPPAAPSPLPQ